MESFQKFGFAWATKTALWITLLAFGSAFVIAWGNNCPGYLIDRVIHAYGLWLGLGLFICCVPFVYAVRPVMIPAIFIGMVLMCYGALYLTTGKEFLPTMWEFKALEPVLDVLFPDEYSGMANPAELRDYPLWECKYDDEW